MYAITYSPRAQEGLSKLKKSDPAAFKKATKLLNEIALHPYTGTGHPEPLLKGNDVTYSRHITKKDRLIYDIYDDVIKVLVLTAKGHYQDK